MSFFTSSSEPNRRFVIGLSVLVGVPSLLLFALGIYLQPLYGDLTRLGGYAERDFGPNTPQKKFAAPLYSTGAYTRYKDVVVLGDSFSYGWPEHQWQNYLVATTGWSIQTVDINVVPLRKLLDSAVYRATPPRLFIYESVERLFPARIDDGQTCTPASKVQVYRPFDAVPRAIAVSNAFLQARGRDWRDIKLSFSAKYLSSILRRKLMDDSQSIVQKLELSHSGLFSSNDSQALLVYRDDITMAGDWQQGNLPTMGCQVERMRRLVEANGKTRFVVMVVPNKLSAYADFVRNPQLRSKSLLRGFSDQNPGVLIRADRALASAIRAGEQDVYLPDDTHWSSRGNEIAAHAVLDFLRSPVLSAAGM